jgi:hypothetical protein
VADAGVLGVGFGEAAGIDAVGIAVWFSPFSAIQKMAIITGKTICKFV